MKSSSLAAAAARRVGDVVTGTDLYTGLGVGRSLRALAFLNLSGHSQEGLLNVGRVLSRGLEKRNSEAVSELLEHVLVKPAWNSAPICTHRIFVYAIPWRLCTRPPSCQTYRSCCPQVAC